MENKIAYWVLIILFVAGCDSFLEERSQNEIRPSTVKDMEKLLEGEAYPDDKEARVLNKITDIFTDDLKCNQPHHLQTIRDLNEQLRPWFAWEEDMFDVVGGSGVSDVSCWKVCYDRIKGCNVILDYVDGMIGDVAKREHLKGESYVLRGFYYLMLTNFFGMPYNYGDPEKNPAVPLKTYSGVTTEFDNLKKSSVAECYRQVEKDLIEGSRLMYENKEAQSIKKVRVNYLTGYALLSRMYLYMENYDKALEYADLVLKENAALLDLKQYNKQSDKASVYAIDYSPEILWAMEMANITGEMSQNRQPYTLSDDFLGIFFQDMNNGIIDIRGDAKYTVGASNRNATYVKRGQYYYEGNYYIYAATVMKGRVTDNYGYAGGIRTAELYINRAEVYCRRYMDSGNVAEAELALADLNNLRRHRFNEGYVDKVLADFTTPRELFDFCLRERRRELCGEANHRWFDLRRLGMPEIKHIYISNSGQETEYVLEAESPAYQLPIPREVKDRNPNLR